MGNYGLGNYGQAVVECNYPNMLDLIIGDYGPLASCLGGTRSASLQLVGLSLMSGIGIGWLLFHQKPR